MSLQEMRKKKGYSQSNLSVVSGVNLRSIQCYEIDARGINGAGLDILCNLALALDCKITDILTDEQLIKKFKMIEKR